MAKVEISYQILNDPETMGLLIDAGYVLTTRRDFPKRQKAIFDVSGPDILPNSDGFVSLVVNMDSGRVFAVPENPIPDSKTLSFFGITLNSNIT